MHTYKDKEDFTTILCIPEDGPGHAEKLPLAQTEIRSLLRHQLQSQGPAPTITATVTTSASTYITTINTTANTTIFTTTVHNGSGVGHGGDVLGEVRASQGGPELLVGVLVEGIQVEPHRAAEQSRVLLMKSRDKVKCGGYKQTMNTRKRGATDTKKASITTTHLRHDGNVVAQRVQRDVQHVRAVDEQLPAAGLHDPEQRRNEGGLAGARAAHHAQLRAPRDRE